VGRSARRLTGVRLVGRSCRGADWPPPPPHPTTPHPGETVGPYSQEPLWRQIWSALQQLTPIPTQQVWPAAQQITWQHAWVDSQQRVSNCGPQPTRFDGQQVALLQTWPGWQQIPPHSTWSDEQQTPLLQTWPALQQLKRAFETSLQPVWPAGQQVSPAHSRLAGQQVSPQQWEPGGQQVPPQHLAADGSQHVSPQTSGVSQQLSAAHCWPAAQQLVPQHLAADGLQHVSPQTSGVSQQLSPAHCLAGGSHGVSPHWVTRAVQLPSRQLAEQQSPSCVQALPLALLQVPSSQHAVPAGQLVAVQAHCPWALQTCPARQLLSPPQAASHSTPGVQHWPWAVQKAPGGQATHSSPLMPHCWALSGLPAITHSPGSGRGAVQQPVAQRLGLQAHAPPTGGCGPVCTHACVLAHSWHGAPPIPQRMLSVPGKQVSPEQQPGQFCGEQVDWHCPF
jgi:hypothetical protein